MEKILVVKEADFKIKGDEYSTYEGYVIVTNKQVIKIGIDDQQRCCENSGYFSSNDDANHFVDAALFNIKLTDTALNIQKIKQLDDLDYGGIQFVDLETSKGTFQIAVYNSHNGYYGHDIIIDSEQLKHSDNL